MSNEQVNLFILEDDDIDFLTIQRSLSKKRIANPICRARDGAEALQMLKNEEICEPFVILLDLQMPRVNGLEFLKTLRHQPEYEKYSKSVVFVLSTSEDEQDIIQSYQEYIAGYFVKEKTGEGFLQVIDLLGGYWKIVHLPPGEVNEYSAGR